MILAAKLNLQELLKALKCESQEAFSTVRFWNRQQFTNVMESFQRKEKEKEKEKYELNRGREIKKERWRENKQENKKEF